VLTAVYTVTGTSKTEKKQEPSCHYTLGKADRTIVLSVAVSRYIYNFIYLFNIEIVLLPVKVVSVNNIYI